MPELVEVLRKSFRMLIDRPQIFAPKIVSTILSSLFIVFLVSRITVGNQSEASAVFLALSFVGIVIMSFVGLFSSLMVASMVENSSRENLIKAAFYDVGKKGFRIVKMSLILLIFSFILSFSLVFGYQITVMTGNLFFIAFSIILFLFLMFLGTFAVYFLPITLLRGSGVLDGVKKSFKTSKNNSLEVSGLILFSLILLALAGLSSGIAEKLGYIGFIIGRIVSTVANTYLFVVSPEYYLEAHE